MRVRPLFLGVVLFGACSFLTLAAPVINEVAWGGRPDDPTAEWIELYNPGNQAVQLEGWRLYSSDGAPDIWLHGEIPAGGYYLLERGNDETVPGINADLIYEGALRDSGEALFLVDPEGKVADSVNEPGKAWPAGTNEFGNPPCASMERIVPTVPGTAGNWATCRRTSPDGLCATPKAQNSVYSTPPQTELALTPSPAHPGEPVLFTAKPKDGKIVAFVWDFGDGSTALGQTVSHTYAQIGTYTVKLKLKNETGAMAQLKTQIKIINEYVLADFSVSPPNSKKILQSGDSLTFLDESSVFPKGELTMWQWDFGDGTTGTGQTASHTYASGGRYIVTHKVKDIQGETAVQTQSLLVIGRYPLAKFTFSPSIPNEKEAVTFDATESFDPDGTALNYEWDFENDGNVDLVTDKPTISHTYETGGDYEAVLVVVDSDADGVKRSLPYKSTLHINVSPVAAFQVSNFSPLEMEHITFSDCSTDPDGKVVKWHWEFGDGASSTEPSSTHAYHQQGTYTATLTVTDDNGAQASTSVTITVLNHPPVATLKVKGKKAQGKVQVLTGEGVTFDASESHDIPQKNELTCYEWDFNGDGTYDQRTSTPTVTHSYPDNGTYNVTVRVTDNDGATASSQPVTIAVLNRPPQADFTWQPDPPTDATPVSFADRSIDPDGNVAAWNWDFGDGSCSTEQNPVHQFPNNGVYTVTLIVTDDDGAGSSRVTKTITVENALPIAQFDSPDSASAGVSIQFVSNSYDPSPSGGIIHIAWDFGDGTTCPGSPDGCGADGLSAPTHIYSAPGTYTVELVVIDDDGGLGYTSKEITITGGGS